jgi:pyruvate formate-lyase activating enzyme-like uncharacterized protein
MPPLERRKVATSPVVTVRYCSANAEQSRQIEQALDQLIRATASQYLSTTASGLAKEQKRATYPKGDSS